MTRKTGALLALALVVGASRLSAHDGPPFPIVSDMVAGPYVISVWTDPDTTDDGSPGGQFWVRLDVPGEGRDLPAGTRARVTIAPLGRPGAAETMAAEPVRGDITNQFAALVMDHEGRFAVHVTVEGPRGAGSVNAEVDATYDTRPPAAMLALYLAPFLVVGFLWARLMLSRRGVRQSAGRRPDRSHAAGPRG